MKTLNIVGRTATLSARAKDANACGHCQTQRVFMAVLVITLISGNAPVCVHTVDPKFDNGKSRNLNIIFWEIVLVLQ